MLYRDSEGNMIDKNTMQDKVLKVMYENLAGRMILKILTLPAVSKIAGKFLDSKVSCMFISPFIRKSNIDLKEYKKVKYKSYNDFFTREIKPSCRPIDMNENHLISPCDGNVTIYPIRRSSHFIVKNTVYTLRTILKNKKLAIKYHNGYCVIIRLCVDNYHRYCYLDDAVKTDNMFIPGKLHTVNPIANDYYPIYKENSREYTILQTKNFGEILQMEVGALMVGKIKNYHQSCNVKRGQEKGKFEFGGSTIILLIPENDNLHIRSDIIENSVFGIETKIKMGECIAVKE